MAASHNMTKVSLATLSPEHFSAVSLALSNILNSDIALETYAQVVNGLPVPTSKEKEHGSAWWLSHNPNPGPSEEARQVVLSFRSKFNIQQIQTDAQVLQRFQDQFPGSEDFYLRLIEIVAIICHDIAAILFDLVGGGLRKSVLRDQGTWAVAKSPYPPYFTFVSHPSYRDAQFYPRGLADVAGYWAEARIFGGVVLFDRGSSGEKYDRVFLNPTYEMRMFRLGSAQLQSYIEYMNETNPSQAVSKLCIPFHAEENAEEVHVRVSAEKNVFRERWDRMSIEAAAPPPNRIRLSPEEAEILDREYKKLLDKTKN